MAHVASLWMVVVHVGLMCVTACHGRLTPPISFPIDDNGSSVRVTAHFSDVENATTLLLSDDGATLYVGARDSVLSLNAHQPGVLNLKEKFEWRLPKSDNDTCRHRWGQRYMSICPNYILVLQLLNATQLYVCGSHGLKPQELIIDAETFTRLKEPVEAKGHCPFSPDQRNGAVSVDGEMYAATVSDIVRKIPSVTRFLSKNERVDVSLHSHSLLQDPTFIRTSAVPGEEKVYFFFTETGNEYKFITKTTQVSRVAQVCKNDVGGQYTLQKQWTTFAKAELVCQQGDDLPYNILHDIVQLPAVEGHSSDDITFYGLFRSQWSLSSGVSAVCAFKLKDIKTVFSGKYRKWTVDHGYTPQTDKSVQFGKCGLANDNSQKLELVKETFLTEEKVKSMEDRMVLLSPDQAYSRVVGQQTKAANGQIYTVLFLLSESGYLHKVVLLKSGPHIIEEIQVFRSPQTVKNIIMSTSTGMVFVVSPEGVSQVPVSNCSFYPSCAECVMAKDPFCGWDPSNEVCARVSNVTSDWQQDVEQGNATVKCKSSSKKGPQEIEIYLELNSLTVLLCPKPSSPSLLSWRFANHTPLPPDLYLQTGGGRLVFAGSPLTVGRYICVSVERGFEQTVAIFSVKLHIGAVSLSPRSTTRTSTGSGGGHTSTTREPKGYAITTQIENAALNSANTAEFGNGNDSLKSSKSYSGELVAVSVLSAICALMVGGLFWWHQRRLHQASLSLGQEKAPSLGSVDT